jgi:hypothetical protein
VGPATAIDACDDRIRLEHTPIVPALTCPDARRGR